MPVRALTGAHKECREDAKSTSKACLPGLIRSSYVFKLCFTASKWRSTWRQLQLLKDAKTCEKPFLQLKTLHHLEEELALRLASCVS